MTFDNVAMIIGYCVMVFSGIGATVWLFYFAADRTAYHIHGIKAVWEFAVWKRDQDRKRSGSGPVIESIQENDDDSME